MINKQKFYSRTLVSAIMILTLVSIASVTVNAAQNPALNIKKVANVTSYFTIGQTITCTYNVTNSGNGDVLGNITVTDDHVSSPITIVGSVAKNLALVQNQKKPSQLRKLIIFIRKKMTHKG